jgi:hypothetical protein
MHVQECGPPAWDVMVLGVSQDRGLMASHNAAPALEQLQDLLLDDDGLRLTALRQQQNRCSSTSAKEEQP